MKIVTYNINGIRASMKLNIDAWISDFNADIYCFQEVRANEEVAKNLLFNKNKQMDFLNPYSNINSLESYYPIYNCGEVPGYAGTMILSKIKPDNVLYNMEEFWQDNEGRTTTIIIKNLAIINAYIPNGNSRLDFKMQYLDALNKFISHLKNNYYVICVGDYNIAHNEIDLTNPKECKTKSVFLPIERKAFSDLLSLNMLDSFRYLNPELIKYSWRSYRSRYDDSYNSWKYRIDYVLVDDRLKEKIKNSDILDLNYSDHLPCVLEMENV